MTGNLMKSVAQTQRSITIGYGPSFAKTEIWRDLRSKLTVPTEIVSLATAQRYNPALILLDHYLLRDIDFARWTEEFPEAVFLCTDSLDIDADLVLTHSLPYRQTVKILEMPCLIRLRHIVRITLCRLCRRSRAKQS